ncbi:A/G-specific adenine glycosylase [Faecalicatena contorta]|uniref:A/G-specific adenine glycosylase n=1 Tax=Faecalicatena contorta TaxID=39482 RepID=UPI001F3AF0F0|nr:A/G-specific adenine glycosylase [Faecalicatena contorta]MCF2668723.1 DNA/RNA nuclease SfsA [Faecalicatena contorta]
MIYDRMVPGTFLERPNRFIAYVEIEGRKETVHVKNTGRCAELLQTGVRVYLQESENPGRKTKWDLIAVEKGSRMVNMDSQIPNKVVKEWLEAGHLFENITRIQPEFTYGNSRFDLYVEADGKRIFIEVKGVTLEQDGVVRFPDAPSDRAVKHVEELKAAVKEGYEAYVFFVIQMKDVRYFTPNMDTHPAFGEALRDAARAGVHVLAYDCEVSSDRIAIADKVPVVLENPALYEMVSPIVTWFQKNKRDLPWRNHPDAYRVWVSEIMLQQTRVEAVKPYYERFLRELPTVKDLAEAKEDQLLKLWEGLGYYNRVRNMQKAAQQIMIDYQGQFPDTFEEIRSLKGIGNYTAGAISAFAFGLPKPAVDGNVLRVISRLMGSREDIMKQSVRSKIEEKLEHVIPEGAASDFDQGLIELGALVCVPNGEPKCTECPVAHLCEARKQGMIAEIPVKSKGKARKMEDKTVLIFKDGEKLAIQKRPSKGLLAGLYEFPNQEGHLTMEEVTAYSKKIGLMPVRIKKLEDAKHIFSHIEWHMSGYEIVVDELEKTNEKAFLFIHPEEIEKKYSIPSAFEAYTRYAGIKKDI